MIISSGVKSFQERRRKVELTSYLLCCVYISRGIEVGHVCREKGDDGYELRAGVKILWSAMEDVTKLLAVSRGSQWTRRYAQEAIARSHPRSRIGRRLARVGWRCKACHLRRLPRGGGEKS